MMSRRVSRWILTAIAFAAAAGFLSWLILRHDNRSLRLADGREFSVVAVTYGTNHVFEQGPPWARLMARYGSRKLAYRLGYSSAIGLPSRVPSVMVWTRWSSSHSNAPPRFASAVDAHGIQTEPDYATANSSWPKTKARLVGWRFENYPRLQKEFIVRFYEYDLFRIRARREGEIIMHNPAPGRMPPTSAPSAPVTATDNLLECTLIALRCGEPLPRIPLSAKNAIAPWAAAEFAFRENGQPTTGWTVKRLEAFSATGNYFSNAQLLVKLMEGSRLVHFTGAFWTNELDWTLSVEVARTRDFAPESLWTLRLPTRSFFDTSFRTNVQAEARGLRHLSLVAGRSSPDVFRPEKPELRIATLHVNYTPTAPDVHLEIASALDEEGRELRLVRQSAARIGSFQFDLEMTSSAKFVDLSFAIHHSRKMEFRVKPVWVSTNAASTFPLSSK